MQSVEVKRLEAVDRAAWELLARGYKKFYKTETTDAEYEQTWHRLLEQDRIYGLGGFIDGKLVGIVHYLFHTTIWAPSSCYLQDLFTAEQARGQGVACALIEAVADHAKATNADRLYWNTQEHNDLARVLYDKVAQYKGFIRYDYPLNI